MRELARRRERPNVSRSGVRERGGVREHAESVGATRAIDLGEQ